MQTGLRELASPYLHDLYGATLATVHLAVRDGDRGALPRPAGRARVGAGGQHGSAPGCRCTRPASGKVLLAHAPAEVQHAVLADLPRITPYTITQPGLLRRQLAQVLRDDYATTVEEMSLGRLLGRRADPPWRRRWWPRSASSCRRSSSDRPRLVAALQVAARGIGRALDEPA